MAMTPSISGNVGTTRSDPWRLHSLTGVLVAVIVAVAACTPTPSTAPGAEASGQASGTPPASPNAGLPIDDPAYLAGDAFAVAVGDAGADWAPPSDVPAMPNGLPAVRVAFLPASCETDVKIETDATPEDDWEIDLQDGADAYTVTMWPAAQVPECSDGQGPTYLEVGYHPLMTDGTIHLAASVATVGGGPTEVPVVPVFTSADATQPALASSGVIAQGPVPGPERPRRTEPTELYSETFVRSTLPDGSMPTAWSYKLTGCGGDGTQPMVVSLQVGTDAPIEIGSCSEGSSGSNALSLPLPAEGTRIAVLVAGGTTETRVRVSEFQWRGDRH